DHRMQRKSDGTVVIEGRRFEIPNRYRHLTRLEVRYAGWDLGLVHLVDERTGTVLTRLYPQDKTQNASGLRRTLSSVANGSATPMPTDVEPATGLPPLLVRCSTNRPPPDCHRPICPRTRKERHREQEDAGSLRPEMEPVRARR